MNRASVMIAATLAWMMLLLTAFCWGADKESIVHSFGQSTDGSDPAADLVFDKKGVAYGTTVTGGNNGYGTVFQLKHANGKWVETVLYSFAGSPDGKNPYGGVTLDGKGNLYGATVSGGIAGGCTGDGCGTIFKLSRSGGTWTERVLYSFQGGNDGFGPGGGLTFDSSGNLYGTTPDGGMYALGTVYELSPGKGGTWKEKVIHDFTGGLGGAVGSLGRLMIDGSGNIFGVTELWGEHGAGTAFKLRPGSGGRWVFSTIHAFEGQPGPAYPYGGLIGDQAGDLYGTTYYGGKYGLGTVFELTLGTNGHFREHVLHSFKSVNDGNWPTSTLVFDSAGNLWGTASAGGDPVCGCGAVFELKPSGGRWIESVPHNFKGDPDGSSPSYGLAMDGTGALYGTTATGGTQNQGVVFEIVP